jgi:hypothetical protein
MTEVVLGGLILFFKRLMRVINVRSLESEVFFGDTLMGRERGV